jgi:hypothetical protein
MQTLRQGFPQVEIAMQRNRKRIAPGTSSRLALLGDQLGAAVGGAAAARSNLRAQRALQCCCNAPSKKIILPANQISGHSYPESQRCAGI